MANRVISRLWSFAQSSRIWWPIGVLVLSNVGLVSFYALDIARAWPLGDWPGAEWEIRWPAAIFWFCLILFVVLIGCKLVALFLAGRLANAGTILGHLWTLALLVGGVIFLVLFPYRAIVERSFGFWLVVCVGLFVAFVCSASELAFATACGVNKKSNVYKANLEERDGLLEVFNDSTKAKDVRVDAFKKARKLEPLIRIGEDYSSRHNPTLVVATNVANMLVAVVSTAFIFDHPNPEGVGQPCSWAMSQSHNSIAAWAIEHLSLRCVSLAGRAWLPFPVNGQIFQTAFALTLILIIGEMLPKQLATAYPRRMCFFRLYRLIGFVFGLGVGPSFGAFSEMVLRRNGNRTED